MATQTHVINNVTYKVNEVVEVVELTDEVWRARIIAFKKDSGHVIVQDVRREIFQASLWRDEKRIRKVNNVSSPKLKAY